VACLIGVAAVLLLTRPEQWQECTSEADTKPDEQIAICSKMLESNIADAKTRSRLLVNRGKAYWAAGRYDLSLKDYDDAIAIDPGNAGAFARRGLAKREIDQTASGKVDIARAKQIDPEIDKTYPAVRYWDMTDAAVAGIDPHDTAAIGKAMRSVLLRLLADMPPSAPSEGTPNARLIFFRTDAPGVGMSDSLRATYPKEMTLILQYQYRDLAVTPQTVSVTASFNGVWENIVIPLTAITAFDDQTAHFTMGIREVYARP
jgi:hypothetical protein